MKKYKVIVIGLGAMGSAALYQLSLETDEVLGIDQFLPPHNLGSSHGETRITRTAIGEGEQYCMLAIRSHEIWRDLEAQTGEELLTQCGMLVFDDGQRGEIHGVGDFLGATQRAAVKFAIAHEELTAREMAKRFPQFIFHGGERGYYEPDGGYVRPERCVAVQLQLAKANGAEIAAGVKVLAVEPKPGSEGVIVRLEGHTLEAERVIVTAGAWLNTLLPERLAKHFVPYRQVLHWFPAQSEVANSFSAGPVYIRPGATPEEGFYGFPAIGSGGVKVALEQFVTPTEADSVQREVAPGEGAELARLVQRSLRIQERPLKSVVCIYTATPDYHFIIDSLPDHPQIVVASPCSGHGFKHSAAIGEVLRDLALQRIPSVDLRLFSFSRFD